MGYSGKSGTVTSGGGKIKGEVTDFQLTESAAKFEYGHNRSNGKQDLVYGIKRMGGTITTKLVGGFAMRAGRFYQLSLFTGAGEFIRGKFGCDSNAVSVKIIDGAPVEATYQISSKCNYTVSKGGGGGSGGSTSGGGSGASSGSISGGGSGSGFLPSQSIQSGGGGDVTSSQEANAPKVAKAKLKLKKHRKQPTA
jgi:hypothetical protein